MYMYTYANTQSKMSAHVRPSRNLFITMKSVAVGIKRSAIIAGPPPGVAVEHIDDTRHCSAARSSAVRSSAAAQCAAAQQGNGRWNAAAHSAAARCASARVRSRSVRGRYLRRRAGRSSAVQCSAESSSAPCCGYTGHTTCRRLRKF